MTLIDPNNHMAVMAALFAIAAIGFAGEKTRIGSHVTGAVIATSAKNAIMPRAARVM